MVRKAYLRRAARPGLPNDPQSSPGQDRIGWRIISRWDGIVDYHTVISLVRDKEGSTVCKYAGGHHRRWQDKLGTVRSDEKPDCPKNQIRASTIGDGKRIVDQDPRIAVVGNKQLPSEAPTSSGSERLSGAAAFSPRLQNQGIQ